MKACLLRARAKVETNPLEYTDAEMPEPGEGQVRVRVHACGVCRTDLHVIEGDLPPRKSPVIPGHQVVGVVEKVGKNAERLAMGAHVAIQVARHWNVEVYASTRDARHQKLALELGAKWAGGTLDEPPKKLDAAIVFAPAGEIVPAALKALKKGGVLVLGGIHMSPIPSFDYDLLYQERTIRSVANNTRQDGEDFLRVAAEIPIQTRVQIFSLRDAHRALNALKNDAIPGAAVLRVSM